MPRELILEVAAYDEHKERALSVLSRLTRATHINLNGFLYVNAPSVALATLSKKVVTGQEWGAKHPAISVNEVSVVLVDPEQSLVHTVAQALANVGHYRRDHPLQGFSFISNLQTVVDVFPSSVSLAFRHLQTLNLCTPASEHRQRQVSAQILLDQMQRAATRVQQLSIRIGRKPLRRDKRPLQRLLDNNGFQFQDLRGLYIDDRSNVANMKQFIQRHVTVTRLEYRSNRMGGSVVLDFNELPALHRFSGSIVHNRLLLESNNEQIQTMTLIDDEVAEFEWTLFVNALAKVQTVTTLELQTQGGQPYTQVLEVLNAAPQLQTLKFVLRGIWYQPNHANEEAVDIFVELLTRLENIREIVVMVTGHPDAISDAVDYALTKVGLPRRTQMRVTVYDSTERKAIAKWDGVILRDNVRLEGFLQCGEYLTLRRLVR
ncbi:hypothetical protein HHX47_DHR5000776 [Lentinula edodes]|nr:hypothetical protein HHX47_DHR5000776 [Lentinula edodes]